MLIGIVGKPNVGKSTFFRAATLAEAEIAPYPFTTIKANEGVGFVRVECPKKDCKPNQGFCIGNQRFVPIKLLDVAGLVPGAHAGKGLGNKFLDDLRQADALIHIIDASGSTNEKGEMVKSGSYDPTKDIKFLEEEIDAWFTGILKRTWSKFSKQAKDERAIVDQFSGLKITFEHVKAALRKAKLADKGLRDWSEDDIKDFATEIRKISKPIIIAANKIDLPTAKENIEKLKKEFPELLIVPCSAESELALREAAKDELIKYVPGDKEFEILQTDKLNEKQKKGLDLIKKILGKWDSTGVQQCINSAVFDYLKYKVAYPVENANKFSDSKGNVLPDAFILPPEATAKDLAYAVHSSIGDKFVRAIDAKTKKVIGKDHILKNGDVVEIVTSR